MLNTTINAENGRGCGSRSEGDPYACCGLSPKGTPIEFFVIDPAISWPGEFQRGVKILPRDPNDPDSINDLVIFVGKKFYPSPWDFVEEAKRFGVSRKLPRNLPFEKLTPAESRMVFVHSKTIPGFEYESNRDRPYYGCRHFYTEGAFDKNKWGSVPAGHHPDKIPCTHALRDLSFLVHGNIEPVVDEWDKYKVIMPSFSYVATYPAKPETYRPTEWQVGIFLALPLTHIEFCKKADPTAKEKAEKAGFETAVLEY